jgi:hypothetical protein
MTNNLSSSPPLDTERCPFIHEELVQELYSQLWALLKTRWESAVSAGDREVFHRDLRQAGHDETATVRVLRKYIPDFDVVTKTIYLEFYKANAKGCTDVAFSAEGFFQAPPSSEPVTQQAGAQSARARGEQKPNRVASFIESLTLGVIKAKHV